MKTKYLLVACGLGALAIAAPATGQNGKPRDRRAAQVAPYIEASQVLSAQLSPDDDTVTYTQVAAGVDASVQGRNNGGSASVRYERSFGQGRNAADSATLSGVARGYASVVPRALTIEAGALATKTRIDGNGGATAVPGRPDAATSKVYSAYAGPNVHTSLGDAEVNANYRIGYTRLEAPDAVAVAPGAAPVDVFDDSVVQSANVRVGTRPGEPLPVGIGIGAGVYQEDASSLDSRVRDAHARADVNIPLGRSVAAVAGVGWEDVEVSNRDAVRNAAGVPVVGADGRLVTDKSSPRRLAYETSGLIWDVGVMWRPSRRTAAEAHIGKRYDSTTYYGSFAWTPSKRSSLNIGVYDGISGFGGQLNRALVALPTDFAAIRNPVTGDIDGCVASLQGGNSLTGVLGSVRSAVFRGRGGALSYGHQIGRLSAGLGAGYDRRKFIAAQGTALAVANGVIDENHWLAAYLSGELGPRASFGLNARAQMLKSGFAGAGDATVLGASAAYRRYLIEGLSANAALSIDSLDSDVAGQDLTTAAALLGLRYDF